MNNKIISDFELVEIIENEPRISHLKIAISTENKEISVKKLIDKYFTDFEEF